MQDDYIFFPKVRIVSSMQFTEEGSSFQITPIADDAPFTLRDLGIAVMEARNECQGRIYAAHKQLERDMEALRARAVAAGLIQEGDPLPSEYLLSAQE